MATLSKSRAQELVRRELGMKVTLEKPESVNGNPKYPYYEASFGNQHISLSFCLGDYDREIIILRLQSTNSTRSITECFYSDTLEFAPEVTESFFWDDVCELTENADPAFFQLHYSKVSWDARERHRKANKGAVTSALSMATDLSTQESEKTFLREIFLDDIQNLLSNFKNAATFEKKNQCDTMAHELYSLGKSKGVIFEGDFPELYYMAQENAE